MIPRPKIMSDAFSRNMEEKNLDLCVWKIIAEKDKLKDDSLKTLNPNKKCYNCKGNDYECNQYLKNEE